MPFVPSVRIGTLIEAMQNPVTAKQLIEPEVRRLEREPTTYIEIAMRCAYLALCHDEAPSAVVALEPDCVSDLGHWVLSAKADYNEVLGRLAIIATAFCSVEALSDADSKMEQVGRALAGLAEDHYGLEFLNPYQPFASLSFHQLPELRLPLEEHHLTLFQIDRNGRVAEYLKRA